MEHTELFTYIYFYDNFPFFFHQKNTIVKTTVTNIFPRREQSAHKMKSTRGKVFEGCVMCIRITI